MRLRILENTLRFSRREKLRPACNHGAALVTTLIFLVLITIVLVGFVTTAGIERKTVQSYYSSTQAASFNSIAASVVASRIAKATGTANSWWVSQPGRIAVTTFSAASAAPTTTFVDLSSGQADSPVVKDVSVNLNPKALTQDPGLITGDSAATLPVKWVYIRKDGAHEVAVSTAPAYNATNPVVGRYAYWTDDESARININTATSSTTPAAEPVSHPSRIDLTALTPLTEIEAVKIREMRAQRLFNSVAEIQDADPSPAIANAVRENKESLTSYNSTPDLNRFGEPRIVLTTQARLAGGKPFLDILNSANTDPGIDANLDPAKIQTLFAKLYPYFINKRACDWGLVFPGQSNFWNQTLVARYGTGATGRRFSAGIILNIIDYVRSAESAEPLILPLRAAFIPVTGVLTYGVSGIGATGNFGSNAVRGNSRRLHIVEMGVWLPPVAVAGVFQGKLKVRLYLPPHAGQSLNLSTLGLALQAMVKITLPNNLINANFVINGTHLPEPNPVMQPGEYRTIVFNFTSPSRPSTVYMRLALRQSSSPTAVSYDFAPLEQGEDLFKYAIYNIDPPTVSEAQMTSISTSDPVVNQSFADWVPRKTGSQLANKFGTQEVTPESTLGTIPPIDIPQPDVNASGRLTDVGTALPHPKGTAGNPTGIVGSVGELGHVHSGVAGTSQRGTAWRTLRLQPRFAPNGSLPEWVLLDLFSVPLLRQPALPARDEAAFYPSPNSVAGKINLHARPFPFSQTQLTRTAPLRAAIRSLKPGLTHAEADILAGNIMNRLPAAGAHAGRPFVGANLQSAGFYSMPGELSEVLGLADGGEASEEFIRGLLGFLTTRSNVFSVFSVGQKIKQLPTGKILVEGESRTFTILERMEDGNIEKVSTRELGI